MGSWSSTRRRLRSSQNTSVREAQGSRFHRMSGRTSAGTGDDDNEEETYDLETILSYLIRSGQIRMMGDGDDEDDDDDCEDFGPRAKPPSDEVIQNPDTEKINSNDLREELQLHFGIQSPSSKPDSLSKMLLKRELQSSNHQSQRYSPGECCRLSSNYLPNKMSTVAEYHHKVFCGTFSKDGDIFLSACQDQHIRIFDTRYEGFRKFKTIRARDVGWSILDTAFSPDGNYLAYSSWSDCIHLCNIYGDHETHNALTMFPQGEGSFAIFSLCFSSDNKEILGGANDGNLYIYDRDRNERTLRIDAHEDDVNAVAFADESSHIIFSGGDDGLVKVWDRRTLCESNPNTVGIFAGHSDGITFIDSRGDARYLLSNSKDQTIKLWDVRKFSEKEAVKATKREVRNQNWDYRWQPVPRKARTKRCNVAGDSSIMTYRGHCVLQTLVRARFSPAFCTGQRYIYTGCATGAILVYDVLTGEIIKKLEGHDTCVRDVHWHPYSQTIMSTSWDGAIGRWYYSTHDHDDDGIDTEDDEEEIKKRRRRKIRPPLSRGARARRIVRI